MKRQIAILPAFEANYKAKHLVARLKMVVRGFHWYRCLNHNVYIHNNPHCPFEDLPF